MRALNITIFGIIASTPITRSTTVVHFTGEIHLCVPFSTSLNVFVLINN